MKSGTSDIFVNRWTIHLPGAIVFVLLYLLPGFARGQDQTNFTQFYLNPYLLNPSYAGFDGQPAVSLIYRKQWMTIDGAPTITNASIQAPVNDRISVGINVTNEAQGFFNNSALMFSVAYHVPLQDHAFVRFGMSAGGAWNTVDMKKLDGVNDPVLANVLDRNASVTGNAGASFHYRSFNVGMSLPTLFSPAYVSEDAFTVKEVRPFQALIIHASNRFYFNSDKYIFEPYVVYRMNTGLPAQAEFTGVLHLNHVLWAGGSYKQYYGVSALGGVKLRNVLAIGASYSLRQGGVDELNSPGFEFSLNYLFGSRRKGVAVYSFVNAVKVRERKTSPAAQRVLAERKKQVEEEKREKAAAAAKLKEGQEEKRRLAAAAEQARRREQQVTLNKPAKEDNLRAAETAEKRAEVETGVERLPEGKAVDEVPVSGNVTRTAPESETEAIRNAARQADGNAEAAQPPASSVKAVPEGKTHAGAEPVQHIQSQDAPRDADIAPVRHETLQRGDHPDDLLPSEYVVAGVFKSAANAQHFSNGLRRLDYNAHYGYLTPTELWYVYVLKTADPTYARKEQARLRTLILFKDAWLLTVQP